MNAYVPEDAIKVISEACKLILLINGLPKISIDGLKMSDYTLQREQYVIAVYNGTENAQEWQAADNGDYLIFNGIPEELAQEALSIYSAQGPMMAAYFLAAKGFNDQYTTDSNFVENSLLKVGQTLENGSGRYQRDGRDTIPCWREADGLIRVFVDGSPKIIEVQTFERDYRLPDGNLVSIDMVPFAEQGRKSQVLIPSS